MVRFLRLIGFCILVAIVMATGWTTYQQLLPCQRPLVVSIGAIDERFGLEATAFQRQLEEAIQLWESGIDTDIFSLEPTGGITVTAVYDHRQEALMTLKELGIRLDSSEDSYEAIRLQHASLQKRYDARAVRYGEDIRAFEVRKAAFEAKAEAAENTPLSPRMYEELQNERQTINAQVPLLEKEYTALEALRRDVNVLVTVLNRLAAEHNQSVDTYKGIGNELGNQYEAGLYQRRNGQASITIYAFADRDELTRLLAHELGHALGLPHIDDPQAIMYAFNESKNSALAQSDLEAIRKKCGVQ